MKPLRWEYWKACDLTLADDLDSEQEYKDQDAGFYIENGVKRGIARRVISDIGTWARSILTSPCMSAHCVGKPTRIGVKFVEGTPP
ncbi:hypothetical protein B0T24DRAFT_631216 [Lasiosphaeria ovina]|uniref:Uncharacterized protein n=1 Tax=Lasiosphaeria ovina TaxID=92902 RepID=A0AAE0K3K4_9PEZI|nr:hypothetical protein B0T24DRAFT_631216 [Lasiosphaeria ovina]